MEIKLTPTAIGAAVISQLVKAGTLSQTSIQTFIDEDMTACAEFGVACMAALEKSIQTGNPVTVRKILERCETHEDCLDAVQISIMPNGAIRCLRWHMG